MAVRPTIFALRDALARFQVAAMVFADQLGATGASPRRLTGSDHSGGASRKALTLTPRGSWPSTSAVTSDGARKASEIVMLM